MLFVSLSVHSFIEGIPLSNPLEIHEGHHHDAGNSLLLGIVLHQIPVAIALMTVFKNKKMSNLYSWIMLITFSFMTPLGLIFGLYSSNSLSFLNMNFVLAVVVGMFLHISTTIIFETSENHKFNIMKLSSILLGVLLALWLK